MMESQVPMHEWLADRNDEALLADGFDAAFVGVVDRSGLSGPIAVYDAERCIEILIERDGMTHEDADEFFSFNVLGAYVGENTPMYLTRYGMSEIERLTNQNQRLRAFIDEIGQGIDILTPFDENPPQNTDLSGTKL